ncbi:MAG: amidase [Myxococcaceae bacterium]|nr:amidase [Myxococcaceae bacterium]MBH2006761.1 amidase [Myxococcaceae bacterium]
MNEILRLSGVAQAQLLSKREISSLELTRAYLERIESLNPTLQAFAYIASKQAQKAAHAWDRAHQHRRAPISELSGVPTAVKDLNLVRWMPARMGSRAFHYFVPPFDDPNVRRMRRAGLIFLGKTGTSEFGATPFAPAKNPWDLTRTAGGSSGGAACAVASGLIPFGHASDGGGSIRIPAALCGLIGFKASRGSLHHIVFADHLKMVNEGSIAHSWDDIIAFLKILAKDPQHFELPASLPPKRYRIQFYTRTPVASTDPELVKVTLETASLLEKMGHDVIEGSWPDLSYEDFTPIWTRTLANIPVLKESALEGLTAHFRKKGRTFTHKQSQFHLQKALEMIQRSWDSQIDFHLSPSVACQTPRISTEKLSLQEQEQAMIPLGAYTAIANVLGYPAVSLPVREDSSGMPIGVQLMAPLGKDTSLIELARQIPLSATKCPIS